MIKTASELYREIKRRGLHLRKINGRDNSLLIELADKLKCQPDKIQIFLDKSDLSARDFLIIFLDIAQPFSLMFKEIWKYLSDKQAPNVLESITIQFGFENETKTEINLEQFRKYVLEIEKNLFIKRVWNSTALQHLFQISSLLKTDTDFHPNYAKKIYHIGKQFGLPTLKLRNHPFDKVVKEVYELFQNIIEESVKYHNRKEFSKIFSKSINEISENRDPGEILPELLPSWYKIFLHLYPINLKDQAYQIYQNSIKPNIQEEAISEDSKILKALDLLELPFWKNRWHTYEIWSTILVLKTLDEYNPILNIIDNRFPIDGYNPATIANLKVRDIENSCVALQIRTECKVDKRKFIKPDLRICYSTPVEKPDNTAAIVEFKQRKKMNNSYVNEIINSYYNLNYSPKIGGLIITNYDDFKINLLYPDNCYYIDKLRPDNSTSIQIFRNKLLSILQNCNFIPDNIFKYILLDISGSMERLYHNKEIFNILYQLSQNSNVKILKFNSGLVDDDDITNITTSGETELGKALHQLQSKFGKLETVLVITDGEHDNPIEMIKLIPNYKECMPDELSKNINFIKY